MAKAIKLNVKSNFDFILIGLVTTEPIYRLGWLLNQALMIQLTDAKSISVIHKQSNLEQVFTRFSFLDEAETYFELFQNKGNDGMLIEEQKTMDYFLKISDGEFDSSELVAIVKQIKNISLAINLSPGSLKSKDRLVSYTECD